MINTWSGVFEDATAVAYKTLTENGSALDAIEMGCKVCEEKQCDTSVGYGNHPDTHAHTSLDAMIMDGDTFDVGSVGFIRKFRDVISIARYVMVYTSHTLLVGEGAEEFASMMGFPIHSATTNESVSIFESWTAANCQPNFYENIPEATTQCGPYTSVAAQDNARRIALKDSNVNSNSESDSDEKNNNLVTSNKHQRSAQLRGGNERLWKADRDNHDTIGMVSIDDSGSMACGTSTNGASHKVAGRVGDSPITGAGCFVDSKVGGCAATGDGDVMMRLLPSFYAVTLMESGASPQEASERAIKKLSDAFPTFSGGVVCVNKALTHGGAANNMSFTYSYAETGKEGVQVVTVA